MPPRWMSRLGVDLLYMVAKFPLMGGGYYEGATLPLAPPYEP
jgi:hypothetical protein